MPVIRDLVTRLSFKVDTTGMTKANKAMSRIGQRMTNVGKSMSIGLTLPIVAATAGVLKFAGDFETGMNRVRVLTGATGADFNKLREQAKMLGATTAFSAVQASEAMGFLAQAGFDANEIYAAIPATLNLAAASQQDLATTADQLSNIMQGFGLEADQAGRASDVLALAASSSNTNVSQLAEAMSFSAPVAKLMGLSLEETAAAMGFMGNAGIQASRAGTSLRQSLLSTVKKTPQAVKAFKDLGVSIEESVEGGGKQTRNFIAILGDLEKAGVTPEQLNDIFGVRGIAGMGAILQQSTPELAKFIGELHNAGGTAARQAAIQMQGFNGAMLKFKSAAQAAAIAIGDSGLLDFFTKIVQRLAGFTQRLANSNDAMLKFITTIGGILAFLGPLILTLGVIIKLIAIINILVVANPVALIIGAIVAGIVLLSLLIFKFRRQIADFFTFILKAWRSLHGNIFDVLPGVFASIGLLFAEFINKILMGINFVIEGLNLIPGIDFDLFELKDSSEAFQKGKAVGEAAAMGVNKGLDAVESGFGKFGALTTPSLGGLLSPVGGGAGAPAAPIPGGAGSTSRTLNVKSDIKVQVPEGTALEQQTILRETAVAAVDEQWNRILRQAETANTVVE